MNLTKIPLIAVAIFFLLLVSPAVMIPPYSIGEQAVQVTAPLATPAESVTLMPEATATDTVTPTETTTVTLVSTVTPTATLASTVTPTVTLASTVTPTITLASTVTPTITLVSTATQTVTPAAKVTPTARATATMTVAVKRTPTVGSGTPRVVTGTVTPVPTRRTALVPILMYHYVSVPPPDADKYRLDLSVTPDAFDAQMNFLKSNGYYPIRLVDLTNHLTTGAALPDKPIVLTFDDGYTDNYVNAFPILKKYGFTGTFFVVAQWVETKRWGYMSWAQLDEMSKAGMEIGSHTLNHPDLQRKTRAVQTQEIAGSKQLIEKQLATPVTSFAYPVGHYNTTTLSVIAAAGYTGAVTEVQGVRQTSDSTFLLRRIRIRGSYTVADYARWIKYYMDRGT